MTVEKLFRDLGAACAKMQDEAFRDLTTKRIECDEIWAFCAKQKNASPERKRRGGATCGLGQRLMQTRN